MQTAARGIEIDCLPSEILLKIFSHLDAQCLGRCSCVSHSWLLHASTDLLWKDLCRQRWKRWSETTNPQPEEHWKHVYRRRAALDKFVYDNILALVSCASARQSEIILSDLAKHGDAIWDAAERLAEAHANWIASGDIHGNMSVRYFAEKIIRRVNQANIIREWKLLLERPEEQRLIEEGAILIARWKYPSLTTESVMSALDELADRVRQRMLVEAPSNNTSPLRQSSGSSPLRRSSGLLSNPALPSNNDTPANGLSVLRALNYVLFDELGFTGNVADYYSPRNSFINDVLSRRTGIPVSMSVVYAAVARRVGVTIDMIGTPRHFVVKYRPPPGSSEQGFFIDVFNLGKVLPSSTFDEVHARRYLDPVTTVEVYRRMLLNLWYIYEQQANLEAMLEITTQMLVLDPTSGMERVRHLKLCIHEHRYEEARLDGEQLGYHPIPLDAMIQARQAEDQRNAMPKRRTSSASPLYRIGQRIVHRRSGYRGVIYGWDAVCSLSDDWIQQMGVDALQHGRNQPFYKVLLDERDGVGLVGYYAEDNVDLATGESAAGSIVNDDLGLYFERQLPDGRYVPNQALRAVYIDDI